MHGWAPRVNDRVGRTTAANSQLSLLDRLQPPRDADWLSHWFAPALALLAAVLVAARGRRRGHAT